MSAKSSKQKRQQDASKGLTRLELYGVHPDDRAVIKTFSDLLKAKRVRELKKETA